MRDLQLEIAARFATHYCFRAREFLDRRLTLQLSAEISREQEVFPAHKPTENTKRDRQDCISETAPNEFRAPQRRASTVFAFLVIREEKRMLGWIESMPRL